MATSTINTQTIEKDTLTGTNNIKIYMYKRGGYVFLRLNQSPASNVTKSNWIGIGTLPEKFRPIDQIDALVCDNNGTNSSVISAQVRIQTNGTVSIFAMPQLSSSNAFMGNFCYVSAN